MNNEVLNDIFNKLFPEDIPWGRQTIFTSWQNLSNANFHVELFDALYKHYQIAHMDLDIYRLTALSDEFTLKGLYKMTSIYPERR